MGRWRPKAVYGYQQELVMELSLEQRPWRPASRRVGGRRDSAARVSAVYTIRRDELLHVRVRFLESEWTAVRAWLVWAQDSGDPFLWYSDRDDAGYFTVKLVSPEGDIDPQPDPEFAGAFEIEATLCRMSAGAFYENYFAA